MDAGREGNRACVLRQGGGQVLYSLSAWTLGKVELGGP